MIFYTDKGTVFSPLHNICHYVNDIIWGCYEQIITSYTVNAISKDHT